MPVQLSIFGGSDPNVPYVAGSETSKNAADSVRSKVTADKARIVAWLSVMGPATDEMIQDALDMDGNTERPRRVDLVNEFRVTDSGKTLTTRSGRQATAWKAVK